LFTALRPSIKDSEPKQNPTLNPAIPLDFENVWITRIFEYENEKAYRACQVIIEKKIMPKAKASYNSKIRNNRGIIFYDYRS